jgi:hypothetical protein
LSEKASLRALGESAILDRSETPIAHIRPVIAVVDRLGPRWAAEGLSAALSARGARVARLVLTLRARSGAERKDEHVRAAPEAMEAAIRDALDSLAPHDFVIVEGPAAVALLETRLAILVSCGSVLSLPPDVRTLRSCFDLVLFAERPSVLERIASLLLA